MTLPIACAYTMFYMAMVKTCREHGYALALHGSMQRDCDMVAIPWTEEASSEEDLIADLLKKHDLMEGNSAQKDKPHGRRAYVFIFWGDGGYLDFCIMPRSK